MIPILAVLFAYLAVLAYLQFKKKKNITNKNVKKVAFFHPFWYGFELFLVMMEVVARKCYGPSYKLYSNQHNKNNQ